ncbi:hypothetical protein HYE40_01815 [Mycoplasmopsis bovis]|nr:hypothetical protein [Mycoplasmopsis bovis]QQH20879.1 hypothetical protein HYE40_01815 [Mycoplasmopsis bovis]
MSNNLGFVTSELLNGALLSIPTTCGASTFSIGSQEVGNNCKCWNNWKWWKG